MDRFIYMCARTIHVTSPEGVCVGTRPKFSFFFTVISCSLFSSRSFEVVDWVGVWEERVDEFTCPTLGMPFVVVYCLLMERLISFGYIFLCIVHLVVVELQYHTILPIFIYVARVSSIMNSTSAVC
jgi:hypothetical protein